MQQCFPPFDGSTAYTSPERASRFFIGGHRPPPTGSVSVTPIPDLFTSHPCGEIFANDGNADARKNFVECWKLIRRKGGRVIDWRCRVARTTFRRERSEWRGSVR